MENTKLYNMLRALTGQIDPTAQINHAARYTKLTSEQMQDALEGILKLAHDRKCVVSVVPDLEPVAIIPPEPPLFEVNRAFIPQPDIAPVQIMQVFDRLLEDGVDIYGKLATHSSPSTTRAQAYAIATKLLQYLSDLGYTIPQPPPTIIREVPINGTFDLDGQRSSELHVALGAVDGIKETATQEAKAEARLRVVGKALDIYTQHKGLIHGIAKAVFTKSKK